MCQSTAEGGLRCAAHTRPAYEAATPGTPAWDEAAAAYASTPSGENALRAELAQQTEAFTRAHLNALSIKEMANSNEPRGWTHDHGVEEMTRASEHLAHAVALEQALKRGTELRERSNEVKAALRETAHRKDHPNAATETATVAGETSTPANQIHPAHWGTGENHTLPTGTRIETRKNKPTHNPAGQPLCTFCNQPATGYEALLNSSGGEHPRTYRCPAHARTSLAPGTVSGNITDTDRFYLPPDPGPNPTPNVPWTNPGDCDWMTGGCGAFAIAMQRRWPHLRIAAEMYPDHGSESVAHAWAYDPDKGVRYDAMGVTEWTPTTNPDYDYDSTHVVLDLDQASLDSLWSGGTAASDSLIWDAEDTVQRIYDTTDEGTDDDWYEGGPDEEY